MDMLKLLIADGTEEFRLALADTLRGAYYIRTAREGKETLEMLHSFCPDVLVLDMMLPGLDGISLLQAAAAAGLQPMVLATTRYVSDYVLEAAGQLGVGYVMVKPCDVKATVARIADLSQRLHRPMISQPDSRTTVSNLLLALGIPTKLRGYGYLREAILLAAANPGQSITKELYPAVGVLCESTSVHVERSIRSAIHTAWERRDERIWQMYFQPGPEGRISRPTNAAFISRLADGMSLGKKEPEV